MLKKLIITSLCMLVMSSGAFAEKLTKTPVDLEIYGNLKATYKIQNNYRPSLLDSKDALEKAGYKDLGNDYRHGANNRASQTTRAVGELTMVARAGENDYQGTPWYNMIAVMQLKLEPKDPDTNRVNNKDGAMKDIVQTGDVWVRYSPFIALGVKVGVQTIAATAPAAAIGHVYAGDPDGDFVYYTVSVLDERPGISIDFHPTKDIEIGVGQLQGMGDFSAIVSKGSSEQANNSVFWFKGNFGMVEAALGYQSIAVGGKETDSASGIPDQWQHEYKHAMMNYTLKFNIGDYSPYLSMQTASGEAVSENVYKGLNTKLAGAGLKTLNNNDGARDVEGSFATVGLIAKLGELGKVAVDYTTVTTPAWGEKGNLSVGTELSSISHFNYEYPITESCSATLFYNFLSTKDDAKLREDLKTMRDNVATAEALYGSNPTESQKETLDGLKKVTALIDSTKLTSTKSFGVQLTMKFGN